MCSFNFNSVHFSYASEACGEPQQNTTQGLLQQVIKRYLFSVYPKLGFKGFLHQLAGLNQKNTLTTSWGVNVDKDLLQAKKPAFLV